MTRTAGHHQIKADILTEFWAMKISCYSEKFQLDLIQAVIVTFTRGDVPWLTVDSLLYTGLVAGRVRREGKNKAIALNSWYRPHNTVYFVPAIPTWSSPKSIRSVLINR